MEIHASFWTWLAAHFLHKDLETFKFLDHAIAAGITFFFIMLIVLALKSKIKLIPGPFQQLIEVVVQGLSGMLEDNIGPQGKKYLPLIGTLAFFIFISNLLGMIPTFSSATGNFNTTVACALIVFVYYNYQGFKEHGLGYLKHFAGPIIWLAPLMIPIEIISHLARPFSLSVRLFGNISGEHIVTAVFYTQLVPWLVPVPIMFIGLLAAFLQTFVFIMLTQIYIAGAIAHDH
ncbi:MAG: ATP synthase F0 subunit A [Acidobacteria bacterium]|nr:MAG: ATP synthase F0 subunit A [Acidobacteriota bacterium]